ncbi:MAG: TonB-dependent receptor [Bacteroidales bacterium]|jgi:hemoglobin/transferrin/lactoferrin receptor protein|nr:TonB-dependent receptor [Bacteroidales bacterium]
MIQRFFVLLFMFFIFTASASQTVTITDVEDQRPVADVLILNADKTKHIFSNKSGKADISSFSGEEEICFQNVTYERMCLSWNNLMESGFRVRLTKKVFAIEEFVITASRREESRDEVPNRVTTISHPFVQIQSPQTAADLVGISGEVFIQKSQLGGGSPMIRGFATNRVLIVVDGVRMNNAIYREGNIQNIISLDPNSLESAEIIFGPGAVVYGSDAIGGVMDFRTSEAVFSGGKKPFFKSGAMIRHSTADNEKTMHLDFNAGGRKLAFLTSFTRMDYDDLKMGSRKNDGYQREEYVARIGGRDTVVPNPDPRIQVRSGYSQLNTVNSLRIKIAPDIELTASNHYSRLSDVPRYDRLIQYKNGKLRYGDWYYGPQIWMMNNVKLKATRENRLFDKVQVTASHQDYTESRHDRSFGKTDINEQTENVLIFSLNTDFDKNLRDGRSMIYYGFEGIFNDIRSEAHTRNIETGVQTPAGSRYPNGKNRYGSFSVYSGYKNNLSEKLTLNTGLRYNHVTLRSEIADNSFYDFPFTEINISNGALTGSSGIVFRANEKLLASFNISTGFRAPNLDDAGKVFDSAPGVVVVPNPGLKPEYAWNIDLSFSKEFGDIVHADFTAFHSWLTNAMVRNDFLFDGQDSIEYLGTLSKVEAMTNSGSARVYGFSVNMLVNIAGNFSLKSVLNVTEGYEENGDPLRHAAPVFGSTHLIFDNSRLSADFYSGYNGAKIFEKMAPSETEKPYLYASDKNGNPWSPGWYTLNFKMSYKFLNRITLMAGIENILDHRYRPYSSGIVAAGRNFIFSLQLDL